MRLFWLQILLVFLPFALYRTYIWFVMRHKVESGGTYNEVPVATLFAAGLLLAVISLVITGLTGDRVTEGTYTPARFEDGEIVPPKVEPDPDASALGEPGGN